MKYFCKPYLLAAVAVFATGLAAQPNRPMPTGSYACHVVTDASENGIVFVQADSVERAAAVAADSAVYTGIGSVAQAAEVMQCIVYPSGKFADSSVQALLDTLAL